MIILNDLLCLYSPVSKQSVCRQGEDLGSDNISQFFIYNIKVYCMKSIYFPPVLKVSTGWDVLYISYIRRTARMMADVFLHYGILLFTGGCCDLSCRKYIFICRCF